MQSNFPDLENRGRVTQSGKMALSIATPLGTPAVIGPGYLTETDPKLNIVVIEIVSKEESAE